MVTTRERTETHGSPDTSGTAERWREKVLLVTGEPGVGKRGSGSIADLFPPASLPDPMGDAWTLSHEPSRETPELDPVGANSSAGTLASPQGSARVPFLFQYLRFLETAATYSPALPSESLIQFVYHVAADIIGGRIVEDRARAVIARAGLRHLVLEMAELVDTNFEPSSYRGGSVVYRQSIEDPEDWEIVVVSKLAVSRHERFDLSLRIGEALSQLVASGPSDVNWMHVTFSLELA